MTKLARYRKAAIALLGALAVIGAQLPPDAPSWLSGACAVATALAVYVVPNAAPPSRLPPSEPTRFHRGGVVPSDQAASEQHPPRLGYEHRDPPTVG